jgi:NAD-dependent deacetylase
MSAESGIPTFRDADHGLWQRFDPQRLATPQAVVADPALVWGWYLWRMRMARAAQPHAGHRALAELAEIGVMLTLVTQNVDDLHERAGSRDVVHLHGSLFASRCFDCAAPAMVDIPDVAMEPTLRVEPPRCTNCGGRVRPGVVWFDESLPAATWARAVAAVERSDLVLVVGTSGLVYPAAALPDVARARGARVVEINPLPSGIAVDLQWPVTAVAGLSSLRDACAG